MAVTVFYADQNMQDIGVLKGFKLDLTVSMETGANDFEVRTSIDGIEMDEGYYIYAEDSEYGGIIDSKRISTKDKTLYYSGRTWRGMLESKIIQPPTGEDYYKASGDLNVVLDTLIDDFGLNDLFYADSVLTGVTVTNYQFYRYTDVYSGIIRLLSNLDYKLVIEFDTSELKCKIGAVPIVDYGENQEVTSDLYDFDIRRVGGTVNHLIGLGAGDLKDRLVIHKYADANGNISDTQTLFGKDEITAIYDYSNAEDATELEEKMLEEFQKLIGSDSIEITLNEIDADVGDKVTAYEEKTEIEAIQYVQSKIVTIDDDTINVQHSGKTVSVSEHGEIRQSTEYEKLKEELDTLSNEVDEKLSTKQNAGFGTPTETSFNNITTAGNYWVDPNVTTSNAPNNDNGVLQVLRANGNNAGVIEQIFWSYRRGMFYREFANNQWYAWKGGVINATVTSIHSSYKIDSGNVRRIGDIVYVTVLGHATAQITSASSTALIRVPYHVSAYLTRMCSIGGNAYPRLYGKNTTDIGCSISSTIASGTVVDFDFCYFTEDNA